MDLSDKEKDELVQAKMLTGGRVEIELKNYEMEIEYIAPSNLLRAGDEYFLNEAELKKRIKEALDYKGYKMVCKKGGLRRTMFGSYCPSENKVPKKVKDFAKIEKEINDKYATIKKFQKGEVVKTKLVKLETVTEAVGSDSRTKARIRKLPKKDKK